MFVDILLDVGTASYVIENTPHRVARSQATAKFDDIASNAWVATYVMHDRLSATNAMQRRYHARGEPSHETSWKVWLGESSHCFGLPRNR